MIKKIALSLLCVGALASTVQAEEDQTFIGIQLGYQDSGLTLDSAEYGHTDITQSTDDNMMTSGIRLGAINNEYRGMLVVGYDSSYDTDHLEYDNIYGDLVLDYFILSSSESMRDSMFRPYIGGFVGYQFTDSDYSLADSTKISISDNSVRYGLEGGLLFEVGDSFNIDLGVKYSANNSDFLENTYGGYIALDYKF